jgi:hypothetical protein
MGAPVIRLAIAVAFVVGCSAHSAICGGGCLCSETADECPATCFATTTTLPDGGSHFVCGNVSPDIVSTDGGFTGPD